MASDAGQILMNLWGLVGKDEANARWDEMRDETMELMEFNLSNRQIAEALARDFFDFVG